MNNSEFSSQIVFKVRLDQEIKKIVIHNDEINYNELLLMMQRIFSEKIKVNDEFTIKYTDEGLLNLFFRILLIIHFNE